MGHHDEEMRVSIPFVDRDIEKWFGRGGGGGDRSSPLKEGGGVWERGSRDRPVQRGWSKENNDDSPPAPQSGPKEFFIQNNFPHDTCLQRIRAWGIISSHMWWGASGPP